MLKKLLSLIAAVAMTMSMGFNTSASASDVIHDNDITAEEMQQINDPSSPKSTPIQLQSDEKVIQPVKAVQFKKTGSIGKKGNKLCIDRKNSMFRASQVTSIGLTSNNIGILQGTLTDDNILDFYLFSSTTGCLSISKIITNNQDYTMTLGFVDYTNSQIILTDYVASANQQYAINLPVGDYAWVIQSKSATYGSSYTLQYNMSLPMNTSSILYISDDYQKIYTIDSGDLNLNNQIKNLDYRYTIEWLTQLESGSAWHTEHIWLENPNITGAAHIGGFRFKTGGLYKTYPHAIVLTVGTGGKFTHYLDQYPPRVFHDFYDMAGKYTPREIDSDDINYLGGHYLVYDMDTDTVKEFVSGLSREWSDIGDKSEPSLF